MSRCAARYEPFLGVPECDLSDSESLAGADAVIVGAPFDGGTPHRPGARFGPMAIRRACHLAGDGACPSLALRVDPLANLRVLDAGDVALGDITASAPAVEEAVYAVSSAGAVPAVLGGDHTIVLPAVAGVAREYGYGRISMVHLDAHAGTGVALGDGPEPPVRRLIESGAVRGDRVVQIGLRGYWPGASALAWMAQAGMRSYEMTEVVARGLDDCLTEALAIAVADCDGAFLSIGVDVVDPGLAPGTGTPEPGGLTGRELLDAVRRCAYELPVVGFDVTGVSPPHDPSEITALLANRLVLEVLSGMARKRRDETEGPAWDRRQPLLTDRADGFGDAHG